LFRTLKTQHGERPWTEWPTGLRQRDPEAIARAALAHDADLNVIRFIQFVFYRQWQRLHEHAQAAGILLFGDMPIYIALDCADAWANRQLLRLDADGVPDAVAGVPPDYFSEDGQLWGNPLYDWPYHEDTDYAWWVERMRHTLSMVDVVRIDHFRGFEAYWAVPSTAATARTGAWETGPNDALFNAMRAALGPLPVVAEDLGAITPAVDELRRRQFMPGMSVLQFLIGDPAFDAESIRHDSVAYTGTHDNDTTVGWFHGGPGDVRDPAQVAADQAVTLERTGSAPADIHWGLIRMALGSAACLAIVPVQDFLGLGAEARFNTPGVPADNWRWRLQPGALDQALAQQIRAAVVEADR
ncbi:MAG: 4-alpha-glucanotransferase, partial [Pseudomonadota bacterium]